ncbi:hypothetical protein LINPERHAP1_LOCUS27645 [Linum perenne]
MPYSAEEADESKDAAAKEVQNVCATVLLDSLLIGVSPDGAKVVTQPRHLHSASRKVSSRWFLPKKLLNVILQIRIHSRNAPLRLHKHTIDAQTSEKVQVLECYGCLTVVQVKCTGLGTPSLDQCGDQLKIRGKIQAVTQLI